MAQVIHFLHIPKTAGSSVRHWLYQCYGKHEICPAGNWDELIAINQTLINRFQVFSGHFGNELSDFLGVRTASATVLRDPVARTMSHYKHVFRDVGHPRHNYVSSQSLEAFVLDDQNWPMIENFQARYLVPSPLQFSKYLQRLDTTGCKTSRLSVLSEDARYLYDPTYVREQAMQTAKLLPVIGVTENLEQFLVELARLCGRTTHLSAAPRENVAPPSFASAVPLTGHALDTVLKLTQIDQELFEFARSGAAKIQDSQGK